MTDITLTSPAMHFSTVCVIRASVSTPTFRKHDSGTLLFSCEKYADMIHIVGDTNDQIAFLNTLAAAATKAAAELTQVAVDTTVEQVA